MSSPERTEDLRSTRRRKELSIDNWARIAKRLTTISDYISFRCVCHSWRSAATFDNFDADIPRVPLLMYARKRIGYGDDMTTHFLDLESKNTKISNFPPLIGIPYLSWSGWVLHVLNDSVISLIHFLQRRKTFLLPGLDTFPAFERQGGITGLQWKFFIRKMVLSGSPTIMSNFVVMVIWGYKKQLAFCRHGDSSWTATDSWDSSFDDIIYHNRKLYAVDTRLRVVECDVHGPNPIQLQQVFILPVFDDIVQYGGFYEFTYLAVASTGKFFMAFRYSTVASPVGFRVFEFDLMDDSYREVHDLGNRALFLGLNSSICLDLSASTNVQPNCIYSTDGFTHYEVSETGVYELSTKRFEYLLEASYGDTFLPPTWVVPSL